MCTDKTYNGWKNYETWNVALWIDNEQGSQEYWREQAEEILKASHDKDEAKTDLAAVLKDEVEENNPIETGHGMYSDILSAALSDVDWYEIASNWIDELPDPEPEEEDADE